MNQQWQKHLLNAADFLVGLGVGSYLFGLFIEHLRPLLYISGPILFFCLVVFRKVKRP